MVFPGMAVAVGPTTAVPLVIAELPGAGVATELTLPPVAAVPPLTMTAALVLLGAVELELELELGLELGPAVTGVVELLQAAADSAAAMVSATRTGRVLERGDIIEILSEESDTLAGAVGFALDRVPMTLERSLPGSYRRSSDIASKISANWRKVVS